VTSADPGIESIPVEARPVEERIVLVGSYLLSASTLFFFISFLFAFFYLRELNSNGLWAGPKPGQHVSVPTGSGVAILVCVLASVALVRICLTARGARLLFPLGGIALLLGLAAVAIQCWQYTDLGFGTEDGGYASVFLGWTGFFAIFVFGAMLWLEVILATARRTGDWAVHDLHSFWVFWMTLGIVEIGAFVLLYAVK
jgi:heme/copper-type cytochrome/quinol oxidase subunit 3